MVKILITQFVRRTRHEPKRIIFYRDGVSEGQFPEIQQREITQVGHNTASSRRSTLVLEGFCKDPKAIVFV